SEPTTQSASARSPCSTSLTCFSSLQTATPPTADPSQTSWCSGSATATLKSRLRRSLRLRNTCLLSFSDCASGMCSSRVSKPTGICGSGKNSAVYFLPEVALACPAASAALILVTLKHSKTSPTLTSLKLATPAPHSKPVRTSLTS